VRRALVVAGLLIATACTGSDATDLPSSSSPASCVDEVGEGAPSRIGRIQDYVVYYGAGELSMLSRFDLAIIDPSTLNRDDVLKLRSRGTIVVGYLSVGEIDAGDPRLTNGTVPRSWILGRNPNWGSLYVDASKQGWRELMWSEAEEMIMEYRFDGVFLDTVDTATDVRPRSVPGMAELVNGMKVACPDAVVIQNRGFGLVDLTGPNIDGVMFEDLSTSYDFDKAEYLRIEPDLATVATLQDVHARYGVQILSLDYADPSDQTTAARAVRIAHGYGFVSAVSVIALDEIPDYGVT
jgi:polysaccharide biosynthesis protein PelA